MIQRLIFFASNPGSQSGIFSNAAGNSQ